MPQFLLIDFDLSNLVTKLSATELKVFTSNGAESNRLSIPLSVLFYEIPNSGGATHSGSFHFQPLT